MARSSDSFRNFYPLQDDDFFPEEEFADDSDVFLARDVNDGKLYFCSRDHQVELDAEDLILLCN